MIRTYSDLNNLQTFEERYEYAKLNGNVSEETFGYDRYLNQLFYNSAEWKKARKEVLIRDCGFDMGLDGYPIKGKPIVHHLNPITKEMILERDPLVFNPEYLITVSHPTHNAIHYGNDSLVKEPQVRTPNDTCPWKK